MASTKDSGTTTRTTFINNVEGNALLIRKGGYSDNNVSTSRYLAGFTKYNFLWKVSHPTALPTYYLCHSCRRRRDLGCPSAGVVGLVCVRACVCGTWLWRARGECLS